MQPGLFPAVERGLITLERRLYELVQRDEITQQDALRYANEPAVLQSWW